MNDLWSVAFAIVLAASWNILGGFAGQVSIGYSAFLGIGAYTTALLSLKGLSPWLTLPLAALLGAAFSVLIGLPTFRLRGPYFTIATIGVSEAVRVLASGVSFTGGSSGLRMPADSYDFVSNYVAIVLLAAAAVGVSWAIRGSSLGRALAAVRQDIDAAEALGIDSTRVKLRAHAISAAMVSVAGGLFAMNFQYIAPGSVFDFRLSLSIVLMPIVGGVGTIAGPILGAILFSYLQIKLLSSPALRDSYLFLYGGLLMLIMLFEPRGIVGLWTRLSKSLRRVPAGVAVRERHPRRGRRSRSGSAASRRSRACPSRFRRERSSASSARTAPGRRRSSPASWARFVPPPAPSGSWESASTGCLLYRVVARGVVRTHQIVRPFREMTVRENVAVGAAFGAGRRRGPEAQERVSRILHRTRLAARAEVLAGTLTIGELKRLEIARALAAEPAVLCLDEVMGGLNPSEIHDMMDFIRSLKADGTTILIIEHHVHAVVGLSDRILVLNFGEKIAEGPPAAVMNDPAVVTAYLGVEAAPAAPSAH